MLYTNTQGSPIYFSRTITYFSEKGPCGWWVDETGALGRHPWTLRPGAPLSSLQKNTSRATDIVVMNHRAMRSGGRNRHMYTTTTQVAREDVRDAGSILSCGERAWCWRGRGQGQAASSHNLVKLRENIFSLPLCSR